jgi:carbamoyl-phosphate synthase small subunit
MDPDGLMLSNGPGDPEDNAEALVMIQKLLGKVPILGFVLVIN